MDEVPSISAISSKESWSSGCIRKDNSKKSQVLIIGIARRDPASNNRVGWNPIAPEDEKHYYLRQLFLWEHVFILYYMGGCYDVFL